MGLVPGLDSLGGLSAGLILDRFIVLEGIDGSGKTSRARELVDVLRDLNRRSLLTSEPTAGSVGQLIRKILKGQEIVTSETLAWLFASDRYEHLYGETGIIRFMEQGYVVCDRYLFSSLAYQVSYVENPRLTYALNASFPLPGLLLYLDLPVETAMSRIESRGGKKEMFDQADKLQRIRDAYRDAFMLYEGSGMAVVQIDASRSPEEVADQIAKETTGYVRGIDP